MKNKIMTAAEAVKDMKDGATIMCGGFMACGTPEILIDAIIEKGVKNLTCICNDCGFPDRGLGRLLHTGAIKTLIATHVGLNPEVASRMNTDVPEDKLECILIPQGSLAEMIRAYGAGLGGVLTPTGVGTIVEDGPYTLGKQTVQGKDYLLMKPVHADYAILRGTVVDKLGNTIYRGTTKNFNQVMATAADYVIVAAEKLVEIGEIDPDQVMTSGIFVDAIVGGEPKCQM